jgi:hypothetical protein
LVLAVLVVHAVVFTTEYAPVVTVAVAVGVEVRVVVAVAV